MPHEDIAVDVQIVATLASKSHAHNEPGPLDVLPDVVAEYDLSVRINRVAAIGALVGVGL